MKNIEVAKDFFRHHLPKAILPLIDLNSLVLQDNTYVDEKLRECQSDILYQVKIQNRIGYLYLLLEHQSTAHPLMAFRLWQYMIGIWADYINQQKIQPKKLPLIVPMVFYNGEKPYDEPRDLRQIIEAKPEIIEDHLFREFHLIDTNDIQDEDLRKQVWSGIVTFAFKHIHDRDSKKAFSQFIQFAKEITLIVHGQGLITVLSTLLLYHFTVKKLNNKEEYYKIMSTELLDSPGGQDIMATIADYLRHEGWEKGIIKGKHEGTIEGESKLLLRQIQRKFGNIPKSYQQKILRADEETLLVWGERLIDAESIEDIFSRHTETVV